MGGSAGPGASVPPMIVASLVWYICNTSPVHVWIVTEYITSHTKQTRIKEEGQEDEHFAREKEPKSAFDKGGR